MAVASAKDEVAFVHHASAGDVLAFTMVITFEEATTIVVVCEGGFDSLRAGETLDWVTARIGPQVLNQTIRTGKQSQ